MSPECVPGVIHTYPTQRSASKLDSCKWQVAWESMGECLQQWPPPMLCNFAPEQVQNPQKLVTGDKDVLTLLRWSQLHKLIKFVIILQ